jgi:glucokinase
MNEFSIISFCLFHAKKFQNKGIFSKILEKIPIAALITKRFPAAAAAAAADRLRVFQSHR